MLSDDTALSDPSTDLLGYAPFARQVAKGLVEALSLDGLVVAIYGQWGTGKSSFLSFLRHYAKELGGEKIRFLEFNPWWFSNAEELGMNFFAELNGVISPGKDVAGSALKKLWAYASPLVNLGGSAAKYFIPGGGIAADVLEKGLEKVMPEFAERWSRSTGFAAAKQELAMALKDAPKTIIFIDDIDRLSAQETHQLFRLIKGVANLPNTIYVLAFDRTVVARSLGRETGVDGERYLEKIVQVAFELPTPEKEALDDMLWERILTIIKGTPNDLGRHADIATMYRAGAREFVTKPRDVMRLANTLSFTYAAVKGEVNAADFIALEILRLMKPEVYALIRNAPGMFLAQYHSIPSAQMAIREFHNKWLTQQQDDQKPLLELISFLFPQLQPFVGGVSQFGSRGFDLSSSRRSLRLCVAEILPVYFRLEVGRHVISHNTLRRLISANEDEGQIVAALDNAISVSHKSAPSRFADLINRVMDFESLPPIFSQNFFRALLLRGNEVLSLGHKSGNLTIPSYRRALIRLAPQVSPVRPMIDAAIKAGQVCALVLLIWIMDEPSRDGERDLSMLLPERSWIAAEVSEHLSKASQAEILSLPGLTSIITLWAKTTSWKSVQNRVEAIFSTNDDWAALLEALDVAGRMKNTPMFGIDPETRELFHIIFESENGQSALRQLARQDPPHIPGSEIAGNLLSFLQMLNAPVA